MNIPPKYEDVVAQLETERARVTDYIAQRAQTELRLEAALGREASLREELLELSRKLDVFYSRSHGIKNLSAIEEANDKVALLQQRLTVAERALARIQGRAEMFIDDGMHMPAPSIEAIRDIAEKAALKPAEGKGS